MADNAINVVIKLRRDNDYNYAKVKDTFIPANGEPVLVDTARDGLRVKIGNGFSTYDQLGFADDIFVYGYLQGNIFYLDEQHTLLAVGNVNRLYINKLNGKVYYYNGTSFLLVNGSPQASATTAGIMMLYDEKGQNVDGTITQRLFTDEINRKCEVDINAGEEMIIFSNNL